MSLNPSQDASNAKLTELLQAAATALNNGDVSVAREAVAGAMKMAPQHPVAFYLLGGVAKLEGNMAEAEAQYRRSLSISNKQPHVYNALGVLLKSIGRVEDATNAFETAALIEPRYLEAWLNVGRSALAYNAIAKADSAFAKAKKISPKNVSALIGSGRVLILKEQFEAAVNSLRKAANLQPKNGLANYYLGQAYKELGLFDAAKERFEIALSLQPKNPECFAELARLDFQIGRHKTALKSLQKAVDIRPTDVALQHDLGQMRFMLGHGNVLEGYLRALDASPDDIGMLTGLARLAGAAGLSNLALQILKSALDREVGDPKIVAAYAYLADLEGDEVAALKAYRRARREAPDDMEIAELTCAAMFAHGEFAEASAIAEELLQHNSHSQMALAYQTTALRLAGDNTASGLYDVSSFTQKREIEVPAGYESIEAFNEALAHELNSIHNSSHAPFDQSLRSGTQIELTRLARSNEILGKLVSALKANVAAFVNALPDDKRHPFLSRKPSTIEFSGIWSVRLSSGGRHVSHAHPKGWLSSAYYVDLPPEMLTNEDRSGWLSIGEPPMPCLEGELKAEFIQPQPGALILFPSYFWHGTTPFTSDTPRLTVAFDVKPG